MCANKHVGGTLVFSGLVLKPLYACVLRKSINPSISSRGVGGDFAKNFLSFSFQCYN